jgi:hemin uptake protein HemP
MRETHKNFANMPQQDDTGRDRAMRCWQQDHLLHDRQLPADEAGSLGGECLDWLLDRADLEKGAKTMNQQAGPQTAQATEIFPTYHAEDLTRGGVQARILLNGQIYSLRITRAGKLILTK